MAVTQLDLMHIDSGELDLPANLAKRADSRHVRYPASKCALGVDSENDTKVGLGLHADAAQHTQKYQHIN